MSRVFICYSREDKDFVDKLVYSLKQARVPTWRDVDDLPQNLMAQKEGWRRAIYRALEKCTHMVFVASPDAANSPEVLAEVINFRARGRPVYPVLYRECQIPGDLDLLHVRDFQSNYSEELGKLIGVLPRRLPSWAWIVIGLAVALIAAGVFIASRVLVNREAPREGTSQSAISTTATFRGPSQTTVPPDTLTTLPDSLPTSKPADTSSVTPTFLPTLTPTDTVAVSPTPCPAIYVVQEGDVFSTIAENLGVSIEDLADENNIDDTNMIFVGQILINPLCNCQTHEVRPSESLNSIAGLYGVEMEDLAVVNCIDDPDTIFAGQVLLIPGRCDSIVP